MLWAGLVLTLSRSSLGALLVGLGILGAMRWTARPILLTAAAVVVAGIAAVAISPSTFGLNQGLNGASSGRAGHAADPPAVDQHPSAEDPGLADVLQLPLRHDQGQSRRRRDR